MFAPGPSPGRRPAGPKSRFAGVSRAYALAQKPLTPGLLFVEVSHRSEQVASADNTRPPRPECAPRWHEKLNSHLRHIALTLLVGQHAQAYYLRHQRKGTLSDTVQAWREFVPLGCLPLPHPSPRNQPWLLRNPWFEGELVPELRRIIQALKL